MHTMIQTDVNLPISKSSYYCVHTDAPCSTDHEITIIFICQPCHTCSVAVNVYLP